MGRAAALAGLLAALLARQGVCAAQDRGGADAVASDTATAVSVTVYRDYVALVTETRELDLPAGDSTVQFTGVADTLLPQSVVLAGEDVRVSGLDHKDLPLTPDVLRRAMLGREVQVGRTQPGTGARHVEPGRIVSVEDGIVLQLGDGYEVLHCSGLPESLAFTGTPEAWTHGPVLTARLSAARAGRHSVKLSYLAFGLGWQANYVASMDHGGTMQLDGWLTLDNYSRLRLEGAEVAVIAGTLNLASRDEGGSRLVDPGVAADPDAAARMDAVLGALESLRAADPPIVLTLQACGRARPDLRGMQFRRSVEQDSPIAAVSRELLEEVTVTGARIAQREEVGDYHLYRLPWTTDVPALQTKQIAFLHATGVEVDRFYRLRLESMEEPDDDATPLLAFRWQNRKDLGLGEPLPRGVVRVLERTPAGAVLAGEAPLPDTPEGGEAEIEVAGALDLDAQVRVATSEGHRGFRRVDRGDVVLRIDNEKSAGVAFELHQAPPGGYTDVRVDRASVRPVRRKGDWVFRVQVPPAATTEVRYRITGRSDD